MDGNNAPSPDLLSGLSSEDGSDTAPAIPSAPQANSSRLPGSPATSSAMGGSSGGGIGLRQQAKLLSPKAMLSSISSQLLGEKSQTQQQVEQKAEASAQQLIARNQQDWQAYQAGQQQEAQRRVQETVELKNQALKVGQYTESSAVRSQTTGGDLSEQVLVQLAMKNAQEAKQREQKARQAMSVHGTTKGPQAEGGAKKTSMIGQMQSGGGDENSHKLSDDSDSRQRQREQAMGE